jgi:hypothetical protein
VARTCAGTRTYGERRGSSDSRQPGIHDCRLQEFGTEILDIDQIIGIASDWGRRLLSETEARAGIGELIVQLTDKGIRIALKLPIPSSSEAQTSTPVLRLSSFCPDKS